MYIGGLLVDKLPCDCGAPFAETYVDTNTGEIGITLHPPELREKGNPAPLIFKQHENPERDDLEMRCTRCGIQA